MKRLGEIDQLSYHLHGYDLMIQLIFACKHDFETIPEQVPKGLCKSTEAILLIDYRTMTTVLRPWTIFALIVLLTATAALDTTLQKFNSSPGLYYDHVGETVIQHRVEAINIFWPTGGG